MIKRAVIICLPWLVSGCSGLWGTQTPAPVFSGGKQQRISQPEPAAPPQSSGTISAPASATGAVVKTQPLGNAQTPSATPLNATPAEPAPTIPQPPSAPASQNLLEPALVPSQVIPKAEALPALETLESFQPSTPLSPAVGSLLASAEKSSYSGSLDNAAASIERAIRIEPRNPTLLYKLAEIRIKQSKPRLAEDLTKKALLLSGKDNRLKKQCWLLIGNARIMQNNAAGAKEAKANAAKF